MDRVCTFAYKGSGKGAGTDADDLSPVAQASDRTRARVRANVARPARLSRGARGGLRGRSVGSPQSCRSAAQDRRGVEEEADFSFIRSRQPQHVLVRVEE